MVKQEDIFAALMDGADPEELAKKFTDALNGAIAEKKESDRKAEEEAAAKKAAELKVAQDLENKKVLVGDICDLVDELIDTYYPKMAGKHLRDEGYVETIINALDLTYDTSTSLFDDTENLLNRLDELEKKLDRKCRTKPKKKSDPLEEFLKDYGLM